MPGPKAVCGRTVGVTGAVMIGIFGGSGFYDFLDDARDQDVATPYGPSAAPITVGTVDGVDVAFLPRHGRRHQFPAHKVPYRANVWAMREIGVDRIIGPSAVGSLQAKFEPGSFVVCDQLIDWNTARTSTFFDGPDTVHVSFADPYCPELGEIAVDAGRATGVEVHRGGAVVVIPGPRFSTRAESEFFTGNGWAVINMTQFPEAFLARELEICYAMIGVVTDYDAGVVGAEPVTHAEVLERFGESIESLRDTLRGAIPAAVKTPRNCPCATARAAAGG